MTITEQREHAPKLLAQVDDEFFAAVYAMLETYVRLKQNQDPIVGYEADGTAVRASVAQAQFAEDLSKPEEFMTIDDFAQELETQATT